MMDERDTEDRLESFFAAARDAAPQPRPDLFSRIAEDAAHAQPRTAPGLLGRFADACALLVQGSGGWRGAAALTASALFGLWLGMGDVDALGYVSDSFALEGAEDVLEPEDPFAPFQMEG